MAQKTNHNCGIHAAKIDIFGKLRNFLAVGRWLFVLDLHLRVAANGPFDRLRDLSFTRGVSWLCCDSVFILYIGVIFYYVCCL